MNKNKLKVPKKSKRKYIIYFLILAISYLSGCSNKNNTNTIKSVQVINVSKTNENAFIETDGLVKYINNLEKQICDQDEDINKKIEKAQICVNENQKDLETKIFEYEKNTKSRESSQYEILDNATILNENYLKNIDSAIYFTYEIIKKNDSNDYFKNIFSVKNLAVKDEMRNYYTKTKKQYELLYPENTNIKIGLKKTIEVSNLTIKLLDTTLSALESSITSSEFKEIDLNKLITEVNIYKNQITKNKYELEKTITIIEKTIEDNTNNIEYTKNILKVISSDLEKCKLTLSMERQNQIFSSCDKQNRNIQFTKKITISISNKYKDYIKDGEKIRINENIVGIISSIKNDGTELEIYTNNLSSTNFNVGNIINLKIYINKYMDENNSYMLPLDVINFKNGKAFVYIVENNMVSTKEIQYIQITNKEILVTSGILNGDQIVINQNNLHDGERVEIEEY